MKALAKKLFLIMALCFCLGATVFAAQAEAAGTVKNATVRKSGKYYIGYKSNGKKIRNKWGIVKVGSKTYTYYFDKKGRAYTGVHAIGENATDTKLYFFSSKGRLNNTKTKKLQKYSKAGKKMSVLRKYIAKIDKNAIYKVEDGCGIDLYVYENGFTVYVMSTKKISHILVDA